MRKTIMRIGVALALVALLTHVERAQAQDGQTPTEVIAGCIENSWEKYEQCMDDSPWYYTWPCGWKLEADVLLCVPTFLFKK